MATTWLLVYCKKELNIISPFLLYISYGLWTTYNFQSPYTLVSFNRWFYFLNFWNPQTSSNICHDFSPLTIRSRSLFLCVDIECRNGKRIYAIFVCQRSFVKTIFSTIFKSFKTNTFVKRPGESHALYIFCVAAYLPLKNWPQLIFDNDRLEVSGVFVFALQYTGLRHVSFLMLCIYDVKLNFAMDYTNIIYFMF